MSGIGVKPGTQAADTSGPPPPAKHRSKLLLGLTVLIVLACSLFGWQKGWFDEWLTPRFEVTAIDVTQHSMKLERANHVYVVGCADLCGDFRVGSGYNMEPVEGGLRSQVSGRSIVLPILEEEVGFTTPGGRG